LISNKAGFWSALIISPVCPYPSDLSDQEWKILAPLIPPAKELVVLLEQVADA
jgi:hypothetical protein